MEPIGMTTDYADIAKLNAARITLRGVLIDGQLELRDIYEASEGSTLVFADIGGGDDMLGYSEAGHGGAGGRKGEQVAESQRM